MASRIAYKAAVEKDLRRLDRQVARRVIGKIEGTLSGNRDAGIPLSGEFRGLFKFRVGDYRAVYAKTPEGVLILRIAHRKDVYR